MSGPKVVEMDLAVPTELYENEHYSVLICETEADTMFSGVWYEFHYGVYNRATGVCEFKTPALPSAMHVATQLHVDLVKQPWLWLEAAVEDTPEEDTFEADMAGITAH